MEKQIFVLEVTADAEVIRANQEEEK